MPQRKPSPEETEIINKHIAAILTELNAAGIFSNAVLAFVALEGWDYHLAIMLGREVEDADQAMDSLVKYVRDELESRIDGIEHRTAETPEGQRHEGIVMDATVTESMGWRKRLESVRKIPRPNADKMVVSMKMLDDVIAALDHIDKLEAAVRECEGDGGCRATKVVKEAEGPGPLVN